MVPIVCIDDSDSHGIVEAGKIYYCSVRSIELIGEGHYLLQIYYSNTIYSKDVLLDSNRFKLLHTIKVEDLL